jgi:N-acetylneuraminic acid mutarotase
LTAILCQLPASTQAELAGFYSLLNLSTLGVVAIEMRPNFKDNLTSISLVSILLSCQTLARVKEERAGWTFEPAPVEIGSLAHSLCGSDDERLIAFGGIDATKGSPFNSQLVIYDSKQKAWLILAEQMAPSPRAFAAFTVFNRSVFILGGETAQSHANSDAFSYDLVHGKWQKLPTAEGLLARKQATLTRVGNHLIVFGGKGLDEPHNWARYDLPNKHWHVHPSQPATRSRVGHIALGLGASQLLVWGGFVGQERQGDGFILDVMTHELSLIPSTPLLSARANARAVQIDDQVYIWGGQAQDGNSNSGASFNLTNRQWQSLPAIPDERFQNLKGAEIAAWDERGFLLFGGRFGTEAFNDQVWLYAAEKKQWTPIHLDGAPPGRMAHCFVPLTPTRLVVFGGIGYENGTSNLTQFDGIWTLDLPSIPARSISSATP